MKKLGIDFYKRKNVLAIARDLLGKIIVTDFDDGFTSARIVETEAYAGVTDKASHAWQGKRTARNEVMYLTGGISYVYICYGMHQMFNVVTNVSEVPHAILIRAAEPLSGTDIMLARTGKKVLDTTLTKGPGNMAKALGIAKIHSGGDLSGDAIYIASDGYALKNEHIGISQRIGVDYAGDDALLPYRFYIKGNKFVSGKPVK
ncbi:DNA-3-methyladenine glycosylase [Ferruginibacter paludis]|uniref:DNA-3-methyladenine glycosylase n=1 Tax=Ferruginibacter paludis TaxID=1310417 RepID=UPI0025B5CDB7|nr:DNA-3-methyladenine glycosylase [Ferruginibacter paludis]MDN3658800.1 DNA-3-methyladenine glycosylase [Ferruginibacter paludis]